MRTTTFQIAQEFRNAARRLWRAPGFLIVSTLLISLAISGITLTFSLVDALLLRTLPVRDPDNLVQLFELRPRLRPEERFTVDLRQLIADSSTTLVDVMGELEVSTSLEQATSTSQVDVGLVTANYFEVLGVTAVLGRSLDQADEVTDSRIAVLSHTAWVRHFGSDASVLGRDVRVGGYPYRIVGVMPRGFNGTTLDSGPDLRVLYANRGDFWDPDFNLERFATKIVARLRPGASFEAAQQETEGLWSRVREEILSEESESLGPFDREASVELRSIARGTSAVRTEFRRTLLLLFAGTILLLVMVCLNVGGLLLARALSSRKETAVQLAVGATRSQIARKWVAESLLVAAFGGAAGVLLAAAGMPALLRWLSPVIGFAGFGRPPMLEVPLDLRISIFVLAATLGTGIVTAIVPAFWFARCDLHAALRASISDPRSHRLQSGLSVIQVAICTVLLLASGLMIRTLWTLESVDAGFDREMLIRFSIDPQMADYSASDAWSLQQRLLEETERLPGVEAAALTRTPVMQGFGMVMFAVPPGPPLEDSSWNTNVNEVTPGYFDAMGIELLSGYVFDGRFASGEGPLPVVVNEAFAQQFFGSEDAVGRVFDEGTVFEIPRYRIVGVVSNANYRSLRETKPPIFYQNLFGPESPPYIFNLVVRTASPRSLIQPVRDIVRSIDPRLPLIDTVTMGEDVDRSLWRERLISSLAGWFTVIALAVAAIGLYGILGHHVATRRREIGLRLALGASWMNILWVVSKRALLILILGLLIGTGTHLLVGPRIESLLYEVPILDPASFVVTVAFLLLVAMAASAFPFIRAVSIDPAATLRQE